MIEAEGPPPPDAFEYDLIRALMHGDLDRAERLAVALHAHHSSANLCGNGDTYAIAYAIAYSQGMKHAIAFVREARDAGRIRKPRRTTSTKPAGRPVSQPQPARGLP